MKNKKGINGENVNIRNNLSILVENHPPLFESPVLDIIHSLFYIGKGIITPKKTKRNKKWIE